MNQPIPAHAPQLQTYSTGVRPLLRIALLATILSSLALALVAGGTEAWLIARGHAAVRAGQYGPAAELYLRAHDSGLFARDYSLHWAAGCFLENKDPVRAMDTLVQLAREHPNSPWTQRMLNRISEATMIPCCRS